MEHLGRRGGHRRNEPIENVLECQMDDMIETAFEEVLEGVYAEYGLHISEDMLEKAVRDRVRFKVRMN